MRRLFGLIVFSGVAACTVQNATAPAGAPPAGSVEGDEPASPVLPDEDDDSGARGDGGRRDSSTPRPDSGAAVEDLLGTLSGSCGTVKTMLTSTSPSFVKNAVTFVAGEKYDKSSLSDDGDRMYDTPNAGGSSVESEVMSFEVLRYCEGAKLLKTETEIMYAPPDDSGPSTITDILVEISGVKIGVSVTRAYKPASQPLTDSEVKSLLEKKLEGVKRSSERVLPADKWKKQILHVFTANKAASDAVARVLPTIDAAIRADTVVLLTETKGGGFIYCNPDPPLGSECPP